MTDLNLNVHELDAAYQPFPSFEDWMARVSVDTVRWDRYNAAVTDRGKQSPEILSRARNIATRAAALDTGAIEGLYDVDRGFTFTVAFETTAWETALDRKGEQVRPLFEAQLHAYDFVLDLATKADPFSEAAVRELHAEICKAQTTYRVVTAVGFQEQSLPKGRYKVLPNHVLTRDGVTHSYAPVDVTPVEMSRLMGELRSEAFLASHPVVQAAYAHYGLVVIHPFVDGNGRVARALASAFTYRAISMPIVILSELKEPYLNSLERADGGDYQAFVDFMMARSLETMQMVAESIQPSSVPAIESSVTDLSQLYMTRGGYTQDDVDAAGNDLLTAVNQGLQQTLREYQTPNLTSSVHPTGGHFFELPAGYRRPLQQTKMFQVNLQSSPPAAAAVARVYELILPQDAGGADDLIVQVIGFPESFSAQMSDLTPQVSGVTRIRIGLFASRLIAELFAELKTLAEQSLRKAP